MDPRTNILSALQRGRRRQRRAALSRVSGVIVLVTLAALASGACGGDDAPAATATPAITATATAERTIAPSPLATATPDAATATPPATESPAGVATFPPPVAAAPYSVTISAVGDISLAREVVDHMQANGAAYPYALILPALAADITIGNLEGALTDRGDPWPKGYNFRTPPTFASGLRDAGFDVVSLANNHTLDYGVTGLLDTLDALDAAGVRYAGAGADDVAAHTPVIVETRGLRIAFLAYAASPPEGGGFSIDQWAAGPGLPGLALPGSAVGIADAMAADIPAARTRADFVIVMVHAGSEYVTAPNDLQRTLAGAALAAGADAYIGAHAHVVQPVEQRGGQLIAWGLGNFIFDLDNVDLANIPQPRVTLALRFTLTKGVGVTAWDAIPLVQDAAEDRPRPPTATEAAILLDQLTP